MRIVAGVRGMGENAGITSRLEKIMRHVLDELPGLGVVLDAIIPKDGFASATEAGVQGFLDRVFSRALVGEWEGFKAWFLTLDAAATGRFGVGLAGLSADQATELLNDVEAGKLGSGRWFHRLVELATEGFYADPLAGGNVGEVGWKMIGYSRRLPEGYPVKGGEW